MTRKAIYLFLSFALFAVLLLPPAQAQPGVVVTPDNDTITYRVPISTLIAGKTFDDRILVNLAQHRTPAGSGFYYFMSKTNIYGNALVPAGLLVGGILNHDKTMRQNALYVASSSVFSYGTVLLIKRLVKRPRPFRGNFRIIPVYIAGDYSFPSGHSSSAVTTATALSIAYPKWYVIAPSAIWASSVAYSRMYLGLHYPSDVLTGTAVGASTAIYFNTIRKRMQ